MRPSDGPDRLLPLELGGPVGVHGAGRVGRAVGSIELPVEHVVGRVVDEQRFVPRRLAGEHPGRDPVDRGGDGRFPLGLIDVRERRRIEDHVRLHLRHDAANRAVVGEVEQLGGYVPAPRVVLDGRDHVSKRRRGAAQLPAELAVGSDEQYPGTLGELVEHGGMVAIFRCKSWRRCGRGGRRW